MLLDEDLQDRLTQIIREDFGDNLGHDDFVEICLQLFEDIAGCDTADESELTSLTCIIWSKYHDEI